MKGVISLTTTIQVKGMTCENCERAVKFALLKVSGVSRVDIQLDSGEVTIEHESQVDETNLYQIIEDQGFDVKS